eukprot:TRINITY_DN2829_c0_g1_i1.p1 TRINITY_DN2829_c0_g1~~TRINITY_DN2829_c0_g1_i1.p1  ORF type:complete len:841 (+),score=212.43 TRINITY_DN2829_c0_g1_i1:2-2524(+)
MATKKTVVFINELHYDNFGWGSREGLEIAGPAGTNLDNWKIYLYSGTNGKPYKIASLKGLIPNLQNGWGCIFFYIPDIANGGTQGDGIALVDSKGNVRQFLSYEGQFTASEGPAAGLASDNIPVKETGFSSSLNSLQLIGEGDHYEAFKWTGPVLASPGAVNKGQKFLPLPVTTKPTPSGPIQLTVSSNLAQNRAAHFTDKYKSKDMLLVRRGFDFTIEVSSSIDLSSSTFELTLRAHPETKNSINLPVSDTPGEPDKHYANVKSRTEKAVVLNIHTPVTATVGQYTIWIKINDNSPTKLPEPLVVLFNPWHPDDLVYLEDPAWRNEYILNDQGMLWVGSTNNNSPIPWNFGQFNINSLLCSLSILQKIAFEERHDPVILSRRMSALVNAQDDNGVLVGNWSGNYQGGTPPTGWVGSADILNQYFITGKPVRYAQCWVFSGTLTAIMRCLGIPARSLTNFDSAHDTSKPYNRKVDKYYKKDYSYNDEKTNDSVWNFHVWNDVWMKRPDLKPGYGGWQAIDATPQEESEGIYQTGPAPLIAVKNGDKEVNYDLEFVYAEVNADTYHYLETDTGEYKVIKKETDAVGHKITTKAIGKFQAHDITLEYKYQEGTVEERASIGGEDETAGDVLVSLQPQNNTPTGEPIPIVVNLTKQATSKDPRTAKVHITVDIVYYTGKPISPLFDSEFEVVVPDDRSTFSKKFVIEPSAYIPFLGSDHSFIARVFVYLKELDQTSLVSVPFDLADPLITIQAPTSVTLKEKSSGVVKFKNPLPIPLTSVILTVEGQGLVSRDTVKINDIEAGAEISHSFEINPKEPGKKYLISTLFAKELHGARGSFLVSIK